jgi:hypothetical protein
MNPSSASTFTSTTIKIPRSPQKIPRSPQKSPKEEIIGFSYMKDIINVKPRSPRSLKMQSASDIITINPLKNIVNTIPKNPDWCCKHEGIEIINHQEKIYRCYICRKNGNSIKRYYHKDLLTAISSNTTSENK